VDATARYFFSSSRSPEGAIASKQCAFLIPNPTEARRQSVDFGSGTSTNFALQASSQSPTQDGA
jgi:hypothetical protein